VFDGVSDYNPKEVKILMQFHEDASNLILMMHHIWNLIFIYDKSEKSKMDFNIFEIDYEWLDPIYKKSIIKKKYKSICSKPKAKRWAKVPKKFETLYILMMNLLREEIFLIPNGSYYYGEARDASDLDLIVYSSLDKKELALRILGEFKIFKVRHQKPKNMSWDEELLKVEKRDRRSLFQEMEIDIDFTYTPLFFNTLIKLKLNVFIRHFYKDEMKKMVVYHRKNTNEMKSDPNGMNKFQLMVAQCFLGMSKDLIDEFTTALFCYNTNKYMDFMTKLKDPSSFVQFKYQEGTHVRLTYLKYPCISKDELTNDIPSGLCYLEVLDLTNWFGTPWKYAYMKSNSKEEDGMDYRARKLNLMFEKQNTLCNLYGCTMISYSIAAMFSGRENKGLSICIFFSLFDDLDTDWSLIKNQESLEEHVNFGTVINWKTRNIFSYFLHKRYKIIMGSNQSAAANLHVLMRLLGLEMDDLDLLDEDVHMSYTKEGESIGKHVYPLLKYHGYPEIQTIGIREG
jgi:hypothetical protein